jgi:hypothetical protein
MGADTRQANSVGVCRWNGRAISRVLECFQGWGQVRPRVEADPCPGNLAVVRRPEPDRLKS